MRTLTILAIVGMAAVPLSLRGEVMTLDSCISYALTHNTGLKIQSLKVSDSELAITEAKDRFLPSVDAGASQSFSFGRGLTAQNTYENRNTSSTSWNLGFSLPLFQGTAALKRVKLSELSLRQCILEHEAAKDNLELNVVSLYLQVLYASEVLETARSQERYSAFEVEKQKALVETGKIAEATLFDVEASAAQDRLQTVMAENDYSTALVNLANLLQLDSAEGLEVSPLDGGVSVLPSPASVYETALASNNAILGARQSLKVAEANVGVAKAAYMPTLGLSGGISSSFYNTNGYKSENFGAQMRHNFAQSLGLSLRIPVFDGFTTRNAVRRAKSQVLNAELAYEQLASDLNKEIQLAYWQAKGASEKYATSGETLEAARRSFEATVERFNLGRATQADYEQSKNNLFKTEVSRIQARYEYLVRHRILMFYARGGR